MLAAGVLYDVWYSVLYVYTLVYIRRHMYTDYGSISRYSCAASRKSREYLQYMYINIRNTNVKRKDDGSERGRQKESRDRTIRCSGYLAPAKSRCGEGEKRVICLSLFNDATTMRFFDVLRRR